MNEPLYFYQGQKIIPWLTVGMPKIIDKLNEQITIKSGIKFSNGKPLTAQDVAATFNAARGGVSNAIWKSHLANIANVTAVDGHTVHFTFSQPWGRLLEEMASIPIMPANAVHMTEGIPGTGPFIFNKHVQGQYVSLVANPHYRLGAPKVSEVIFRFVPDAGTRTVNVLSGQTHISPEIPYTNVTQVGKSSKIKMYNVAAPVDLLFWISSAAVPSTAARQALAYAIDRKQVVQTVFGGHAEIGQGPIGTVHSWLSVYEEAVWPVGAGREGEVAAGFLGPRQADDRLHCDAGHRVTTTGPGARAELVGHRREYESDSSSNWVRGKQRG